MSKSILKSFSAYTFTNLFNSGIPFFITIFLTHHFTPADIGILTNISSLNLLLIPLVGLNISSSFMRAFVKEKTDKNSYLSTALSTSFISLIICFICLFLFSSYISSKTFIPEEILLVLPFYSFLFISAELYTSKLRMEHKVKKYSVFKISKSILEILITLTLVLMFEFNWSGRFIAIFVSTLTLALVCFYQLKEEGLIVFNWNRDNFKHIISYGFPLIPHTISGVVIMYSDKLIITNEIGISQNGIYTVAFQMGMIIGLIQNSFNQAWVPWLYKALEKDSLIVKKNIVKYSYLYFAALIAIFFIAWLCSPILFYFIDSSFDTGMDIFVLIALAFVFNGMYKMMVNFLFYSEKTMIISLITISLGILNILLNYYLIPIYGIKGPAIATCITFMIQFLLTSVISQTYYPMPWLSFKK